METKLAILIASLDQLVNYFIPPEIAADRDARNRAHVFLVSHILGPFIGNVVPIALYVLDPTPGYQVAVLAASITAFWIFPFMLRAGASYNPLALVSISEFDILHSMELLLLRRSDLADIALGPCNSAARVFLSGFVQIAALDRDGDVRRQSGNFQRLLFIWLPGP